LGKAIVRYETEGFPLRRRESLGRGEGFTPNVRGAGTFLQKREGKKCHHFQYFQLIVIRGAKESISYRLYEYCSKKVKKR